jgi:prepilin-type N-terminal cleavage/methylation domain-containing protein
MKNTKKAFSLIEVIVASTILSIAVFGVFKLIWENQKLINNSDNYKTANSLFIPFRECLENIIGNSGTIWTTFHLNLKECNISATQTWIILDNIEYSLSWSTSDREVFKLEINTASLKLAQDYRVSK